MATVYQSIDPLNTQRVAIDASINITFSAALDVATLTTNAIIFEEITDDSEGNEVRYAVDFSISNSANPIILVPTTNLKYDVLYEITITTLVDDYLGAAVTEKILQFITAYELSNPIIDLETDKNTVGMYHKQRKMADLLNFENILKSGDDFNYSMTPSSYDPSTNLYSYDGASKIDFDLQTFFKDKLRNQLLNQYGSFFKTMKGFDGLSTSLFEDIEKSIFLRSHDLNKSAGFKQKIQFLIEMYANAIGKHFVSVAPDPLKPFVYYIATDMPREYWSKTIRDLVHPIGWQEIYSEIDESHTEGLVLIGTESIYFTADRNANQYTMVGHSVIEGEIVNVTTDDELPKGLVAGVTYYVINSQLEDGTYKSTFQLSLTEGGDPVVITSIGVGNHSLYVNKTHQSEKYQRTEEDLLGSREITFSGVGYIEAERDSRLFRTNIDLSSILDDELRGTMLYITAGNNSGEYLILGNTSLDRENVITVNEAFTESETNISVEVYGKLDSIRTKYGIKIEGDAYHPVNRAMTINSITSTTTGTPHVFTYVHALVDNYSEQTTRRDLLNVLNSLDFKSEYAFSYLQARHLSNATGVSESAGVSRLFVNNYDSLGLIMIPNSSIKTFSEGDGTFMYADRTDPVIFFESTDFTTTDFTFGNVNLENFVTTNSEVLHNSPTLDVVTLSVPDSNGLQLVTFDGASNISSIQATHSVKFSGLGLNDNISYHTVQDHDYANDQLLIYNPTGASETPVGGTAVWKEPVHHNTVTIVVPGVFSYDLLLWGAFAVFFNNNVIDAGDYNSVDGFLYRYANYDGGVTYPDDDSGAPYSDFQIDMANGDAYLPWENKITSYIDGIEYDGMQRTTAKPDNKASVKVTNGTIKRYTYVKEVDPDPIPIENYWESGNPLYEVKPNMLNMSAFWTMDDIVGVTLNDVTGTNDGTVNNATEVDGYNGNALHFDNNQYVSVSDDVSLQSIFFGGGLLSFWITMDANIIDALQCTVFEKSGWSLYLTGYSFYFTGTCATTDGEWQVVSPLTPNTWCHVMVEWDSDNPTTAPNIYFNNVSQTVVENTTPVGAYSNDATVLYMGASNVSGDNHLSGALDQIRFYKSRVLSDTEREYLYNFTDDDPTEVQAMGTGRFFGVIEKLSDVSSVQGEIIFRFLNNDNTTAFNSSYYYEKTSNVYGDVTSTAVSGNAATLPNVTLDGGVIYDRKIEFAYNIPDFDYYQWLVYTQGGSNLVTGWTNESGTFETLDASGVDITKIENVLGEGITHCSTSLTLGTDNIMVMFNVVDPSSGVLDITNASYRVASNTTLTTPTVTHSLVSGKNVIYFTAASETRCGFRVASSGDTTNFGVEDYVMKVVSTNTSVESIEDLNKLTIFSSVDENNVVTLGTNVKTWRTEHTLTTTDDLVFDSGTNTLTRTSGNWSANGVTNDTRISIQGSEADNNYVFVVTNVTALTLTLEASLSVVSETIVGGLTLNDIDTGILAYDLQYDLINPKIWEGV